MSYKVLTNDYRPPLQGGEPLWDGATLPYTLPAVALDASGRDCAPGYHYCATPAGALRIAGLWSDGWPACVVAVEPAADAIERGEKWRASQLTITRRLGQDEIRAAVREMSARFGDHAEAMTDAQMAWYEALGRPCNVVVTGGEPLVQRRELRPLLAVLQQERYRVEIETNGTIGPGDLAELVNQWNVSPKLAHSGNDGLRRMDASVLREFGATAQAWFKFVVSSRDDLDEIRSIAAAAGIDPSRIVLMPEGRTAEEIAGRSAWLVDVCAEYGYRFTTRLHILLWGDRRGT